MIEDLFKWINQSKITTIGYNHKTEYEKDLILKKLKSYNISEVYKDFNPKQLIRDAKLNHILNSDDYSNFFHLDINDIIISNKNPIQRSLYIKEFLRNIRYKIDNFNFILTTKTYNTLNGEVALKSGISTIYSADLVFNLDDVKIKVTKNRYSCDNIDISLSELEKFNYLCNYEFNK